MVTPGFLTAGSRPRLSPDPTTSPSSPASRTAHRPPPTGAPGPRPSRKLPRQQLLLKVARGLFFHWRDNVFAKKYFSECNCLWLRRCTIDCSLIVYGLWR